MLVLNRKLDEVIVINDNIRIQVVEIMGHRVRLGVTAPKDVPIFRLELLERIKEDENVDSGKS